MESSNQFLGTERIGKLMQKYAIPCIISLLVGALYNIVDQIFIANASYLGSYGNAANTVVFPLTVVALAIAVMIGDGCCAFVSISLGQNEVPKAKRSVGNAVVMCLVSSIVLAALYLIFEDREKMLRQKLSKEERRTRSHRLIVRGAVFESIVPEAKNMTDEEAAALLRLALTSEPAREFLRKRAEETTS